MENLNTAIVRIITRYIASALTTFGLTVQAATEAAQSDGVQGLIVAGVGLAMGAVTEFVYAQARKDGRAM